MIQKSQEINIHIDFVQFYSFTFDSWAPIQPINI